jgi:hypothetical protein
MSELFVMFQNDSDGRARPCRTLAKIRDCAATGNVETPMNPAGGGPQLSSQILPDLAWAQRRWFVECISLQAEGEPTCSRQ